MILYILNETVFKSEVTSITDGVSIIENQVFC